MLFDDDPDQMTAEARLAEVVAILAAGCLRLLGSRESAASTEKPLDCSRDPMALCSNGMDPEEHAA